jgi:hypothetical protein
MNFSNEKNESRDIFSIIFGFYVMNIMNIFGVILNFICVLIFIKILKLEPTNKGHLYKYLFLKSICDFLFFIQNLPQMFYYRADFTQSESYIMQYWFRYCFYFLYYIFSNLSVWFEILASIDCLCLVSRKFEWHKNIICFYVASTCLSLVMIIFYIPNLFRFNIERNENGGYHSVSSSFDNSTFIYYHKSVHVISRDLSPLFILIVINGLILYFIRESTERRRRIQTTSVINTQTISLIKRSQQAERNKIKMILFTSLIHLFHIPAIFYNFNTFNVLSDIFLSQLCLLSTNFAYFIPIISYTAFNNTFKNYILKMIFFYNFNNNNSVGNINEDSPVSVK